MYTGVWIRFVIVAVSLSSVACEGTTVEWEEPIFECWYFQCHTKEHNCDLNNLHQSDFGALNSTFYETTCSPLTGSEGCFISKTIDPEYGYITFEGGCAHVCDDAYHAGDTSVQFVNESYHYTCCFDVELCNYDASLLNDTDAGWIDGENDTDNSNEEDEYVDDADEYDGKAGVYSATVVGSVMGTCTVAYVAFQVYSKYSAVNTVSPEPS